MHAGYFMLYMGIIYPRMLPESLFFELFLAHSLKSKSETLTTVCMLLKETNCCICHSEKSFLVADNRNKLLSFIDVVSEKSSKRYDISRSSLPCICRTALYTARTVVTFVSVDDNPAILHAKCTLAACLHTYTPHWIQSSWLHSTVIPPLIPTSFSSAFKQLF